MDIKELALKGAYEITRRAFIDDRGTFCRFYDYELFKKAGIEEPISQINHSITVNKGTVRGMHFQYQPAAEIKMVSCVSGRAFDAIVDIRKGSDTFLKWCFVELDPAKHNTIIVPKGFAHGFQALEDNTTLIYCSTTPYSKEDEAGIRHNDPKIAIEWPLEPIGLSERDKAFANIDDNFKAVTL